MKKKKRAKVDEVNVDRNTSRTFLLELEHDEAMSFHDGCLEIRIVGTTPSSVKLAVSAPVGIELCLEQNANREGAPLG